MSEKNADFVLDEEEKIIANFSLKNENSINADFSLGEQEKISVDFNLTEEEINSDFVLADNDKISPVLKIDIPLTNHNSLNGRDEEDCHTIGSITGLENALNGKQDVINDLDRIREGSYLGLTSVQPETLNNYATKKEVNEKQDVITDLQQIRIGASLGITSVQPDLLDGYATKQELNTKQDIIEDLSDIRLGSELGSTAIQPDQLSKVATSGDYNDLNNKPTIPTVNNGTLTIQKNGKTIATFGANQSEDVTANVEADTQVNADWNATSGVAQILNKPTIPTKVSDLQNDKGFATAEEIELATEQARQYSEEALSAQTKAESAQTKSEKAAQDSLQAQTNAEIAQTKSEEAQEITESARDETLEAKEEIAEGLDAVLTLNDRVKEIELNVMSENVQKYRGFEHFTKETTGNWRTSGCSFTNPQGISFHKFEDEGEEPPVAGATQFVRLKGTGTYAITQAYIPITKKKHAFTYYMRSSGESRVFSRVLTNKSFLNNYAINSREWKRFEFINDLSTSTQDYADVFFQKNATSSEISVDICAVQFEEGDHSSEYQPEAREILPHDIAAERLTVNGDISSARVFTGVTYTKLNAEDTSQYPLVWVDEPRAGGNSRVARINNDQVTGQRYSCDQHYHYVISNVGIFVYDINCKFVSFMRSPFPYSYHDVSYYQGPVATNLNGKTLTWGASGHTLIAYRIFDVATGEKLYDLPVTSSATAGAGEQWYPRQPVISVNDRTGHFLMFCTYSHYTEEVDESGEVISSATKNYNGYFVIEGETGKFIKWNPETQTYDESVEHSFEMFTVCDEPPNNNFLITGKPGNMAVFRGSVRVAKITNAETQCRTVFVLSKQQNEQDTVFYFDEHDELIPLRGTPGATGFTTELGTIYLNFQAQRKSTDGIVAAYNRIYSLHAGSTADSEEHLMHLRLVTGFKIYKIVFNVNTQEISITVAENGVADGLMGVREKAFIANYVPCAVGMYRGSYGGNSAVFYNLSNVFCQLNNLGSNTIVGLTGTRMGLTFSPGLRCPRLTSKPQNFMDISVYAATWNGMLHINI